MIELPKLIDLPLGYIIFYMQRQLLFLTVPLLIARRSALGWLLGGVGFAGGGCVFHLLISINMQQHVFPLQHATSPFVAAAFQSFHRLMSMPLSLAVGQIIYFTTFTSITNHCVVGTAAAAVAVVHCCCCFWFRRPAAIATTLSHTQIQREKSIKLKPNI